jgi:cellobiose-specific phosphotransferase system component IIC
VQRVCLCVSVAIRIKLFSPYLFPVFPNAFITFTLPKPVPLQVASQRSTKMPTSIVFVLYAGIGIAVRVNEGGGVGEGRESGMRFTGLGLGWLIFRLC